MGKFDGGVHAVLAPGLGIRVYTADWQHFDLVQSFQLRQPIARRYTIGGSVEFCTAKGRLLTAVHNEVVEVLSHTILKDFSNYALSRAMLLVGLQSEIAARMGDWTKTLSLDWSEKDRDVVDSDGTTARDYVTGMVAEWSTRAKVYEELTDVALGLKYVIPRNAKDGCPADTDGDGNCGRKYCQFCGEGKK